MALSGIAVRHTRTTSNCSGQLFADTSMCEVSPSAAHIGWVVENLESSVIDSGYKAP